MRTSIQRAYQTLFERYDVLVCFGHADLPRRFGDKPAPDPKRLPGRAKLSPDGNLCGITLPAGFTAQNLPRTIHIAAAPYDEHKLFAIAELFQSGTDHHKRRPKL